MASIEPACELCCQTGGELLYRDDNLRIVLIDDAQYPGYCRVIWNAHVREMTDLPAADRAVLMAAAWHVEAALREVMQPVKINLASLGNMTPHLHWHVIPRYADDAHFPDPVWAEVKRTCAASMLAQRIAVLPLLRRAITVAMMP